MTIYIIFYILIFLISFKIKKDAWNIFDFLFLFLIICFSGLRSTGLDYFLYQKIFFKFSNIISLGRTGLGFDYIIYFIKFILGWNYQSLIFLFSLFTNLLLYIFFKKSSTRPGLTMLIYVSLGFYTTSFNMFRQTFSIIMCLMSMMFLEKKNYFMVAVSWLIAIVIHSSSIIAIIIYMLVRIFKNRRLKFRYLMVFPIIGLILYDKLFIYLINLSSSYSMYSTYDSTPGMGTYLNVFVYLILTMFLSNSKFMRFQKKHDYSYYNLFLIGVSIMVLEFKNFLFFRIAFYFTILGPIILTDFYEENHFRNHRLESLIFYSCLFIYFLVYINSFDGVIPYKFFLKGSNLAWDYLTLFIN